MNELIDNMNYKIANRLSISNIKALLKHIVDGLNISYYSFIIYKIIN